MDCAKFCTLRGRAFPEQILLLSFESVTPAIRQMDWQPSCIGSFKTTTAMSSLIYITRIRPLSGELAQGLESAGFHVKFFGPGEITTDECLLVMTSEAALAGIQGLGKPAAWAAPSATGGPERAFRLPIADPSKLDSAIWNHIKTAGSVKPPSREPPPQPRQSSSTPDAVEARPRNLGFFPSQAGTREFTHNQPKSVGPPPSSFAVKGPLIKGDRNSAPVCPTPPPPAPALVVLEQVPALVAAKLTAGRKFVHGGGRRLLLSAALALVLVILAVVLLTNRVSLVPAAVDTTAAEGTSPDSGSNADTEASTSKTASHPRRVSPRAANPSAESQAEISGYGFVAEDYTTHFELQTRREMQVPQLKHRAQSQNLRKRVVVN